MAAIHRTHRGKTARACTSVCEREERMRSVSSLLPCFFFLSRSFQTQSHTPKSKSGTGWRDPRPSSALPLVVVHLQDLMLKRFPSVHWSSRARVVNTGLLCARKFPPPSPPGWFESFRTRDNPDSRSFTQHPPFVGRAVQWERTTTRGWLAQKGHFFFCGRRKRVRVSCDKKRKI